MNEPEFVALVGRMIDPRRDEASAREVVAGLSHGLPKSTRRRFRQPLWSWTCNPPPAPDMLLGDSSDQGVAVLEWKGPRTRTQWTARRLLRRSMLGGDASSRRVASHYLDATHPWLDAAHGDKECLEAGQACDTWKPARGHADRPDLHYPVVHQGDVYAAIRDYLPAGLSVEDPGNLTFLFVAPSQASVADWHDGLQSSWHTVMLPEVVAYWRGRRRLSPGLDRLVIAADQFLGRQDRAISRLNQSNR